MWNIAFWKWEPRSTKGLQKVSALLTRHHSADRCFWSEEAEKNDKVTYGSRWCGKVYVGIHGRQWFLNITGLTHLGSHISLTHKKNTINRKVK